MKMFTRHSHDVLGYQYHHISYPCSIKGLSLRGRMKEGRNQLFRFQEDEGSG